MRGGWVRFLITNSRAERTVFSNLMDFCSSVSCTETYACSGCGSRFCSIHRSPAFSSPSCSSSEDLRHQHHCGASEDSWLGGSLQGGRSHVNEVITYKILPLPSVIITELTLDYITPAGSAVTKQSIQSCSYVCLFVQLFNRLVTHDFTINFISFLLTALNPSSLKLMLFPPGMSHSR